MTICCVKMLLLPFQLFLLYYCFSLPSSGTCYTAVNYKLPYMRTCYTDNQSLQAPHRQCLSLVTTTARTCGIRQGPSPEADCAPYRKGKENKSVHYIIKCRSPLVLSCLENEYIIHFSSTVCAHGLHDELRPHSSYLYLYFYLFL